MIIQALKILFKTHYWYILTAFISAAVLIYLFMNYIHDDVYIILIMSLLILLTTTITIIVSDFIDIKDDLIEKEKRKIKEELTNYIINFCNNIRQSLSYDDYNVPIYLSKELYDVLPIGLQFDNKFMFIVENERKMFSCSLYNIDSYISDIKRFFEYV